MYGSSCSLWRERGGTQGIVPEAKKPKCLWCCASARPPYYQNVYLYRYVCVWDLPMCADAAPVKPRSLLEMDCSFPVALIARPKLLTRACDVGKALACDALVSVWRVFLLTPPHALLLSTADLRSSILRKAAKTKSWDWEP